MRKNTVFLFVCVFAFALCVFTGCEEESKETVKRESYLSYREKNGVKNDINTNIKENESSESKQEKLITIGFSQVGAESDWRVANTDSMRNIFTEENGYNFIFENADGDKDAQIAHIRSFISQKVDFILLSPVIVSGWDEVLKEAKAANIPVIVVDRMIDVEDDSLYACWVGSDFEEEGANAVKWLVEYMNKLERNSENISVAMIKGTLNSSAEIGRTKGVHNEIAQYSNYKIILEESGNFEKAGGKAVMEQFLSSGQDIDVLIAQNDDMALGAVEAIKNAGKEPGKDIVIVSFDATRAAFEAIIAGDMNVTVECNPLHGPFVASLMHDISDGKNINKIQYMYESVYDADSAEAELPKRLY